MAGQRWQKVFADFDGATASFPTAALTPVEFFPRIAGVHTPAAITFTVPSSAPYAVRLPRVASQGDVAVTVGGNSRATVLGESPAAGQVGWDLATGKLTFHSSDAGGSASATLTNVLDTVISADFLHLLQKEVAAVQTEVERTYDLGTGLVAKTGTSPQAFAARSIAETGNGLTVTNGDGVSGNPTLSLEAGLEAIASLAKTDGNIIVGNGTTWVAESGATARTSLGLGAADSPTLLGLTLGETATGTENVPVLRLTAQARYLPQIKLYEGNSGNSATFELDGDSQQLEIWVTGGVENRLIYDDHGHMVLNHVQTFEGLGTNGDIGCLGDLSVGGEVTSDLTMGAGRDINVSETGKIWFGGDVNLYRNVANQLATDDGLRAGGVITTGTIWSSHSDNGADATTWLGASNDSTTGSFETNVFGRFRNASNTAVTQFIAFRGITRTAGAEYGEIALRPIVNGSPVDAAKADYRGLVLGTGLGLYVGSTQVVGAQQAAISAPSDGSTVDAEARTAIGSILTALRTHGLIAT